MSARNDVEGEPADDLDLPDTVDLASVNEAEIKVVRAAGQGRLDVREAILFSRMLEHRRRAVGDRSIEERLKAIEEAKKAQMARKAKT
jgi:hypothetical protein